MYVEASVHEIFAVLLLVEEIRVLGHLYRIHFVVAIVNAARVGNYN
jgi:hypothetical protein